QKWVVRRLPKSSITWICRYWAGRSPRETRLHRYLGLHRAMQPLYRLRGDKLSRLLRDEHCCRSALLPLARVLLALPRPAPLPEPPLPPPDHPQLALQLPALVSRRRARPQKRDATLHRESRLDTFRAACPWLRRSTARTHASRCNALRSPACRLAGLQSLDWQ